MIPCDGEVELYNTVEMGSGPARLVRVAADNKHVV